MSYLVLDARSIRENLPTGADAPEDSDALFLLYAVLLRVKGRDVGLRDVHDAWVAWMEMREQTHESMRPFDDLSPAIQSEDAPFVEAIHRVAAMR